MSQVLTLSRDVNAVQIPYGEKVTLPEGAQVFVTQSLGSSYTVQVPHLGGLYRVSGEDADALGLERTQEEEKAPRAAAGPVEEAAVWDELKSCYDPEIPVNIVDLGLVYDMQITPASTGGSKVSVKMTLTAPGCGMGPSIASDAKHRLESLAGASEADVQLVWDPPWSVEMVSPEGKKRLGLP